MAPQIASIIVECRSQEQLEQIIQNTKKVVVLYYSYAMPWGKIAEHKMHVCARALEKGNITTIPFVLVNYAEFYEYGGKIEVQPSTMIKYAAYVDGVERQTTGNSAELEGLVTGLL
ncbi:hypothetical protein BX616_004210 [Lobosporangium transversale]|uniref:Thioredoxin domain-containing protein n=1 Tax=Lobosporangium transversale TaxID=64571 RepID=A0A1Y2GGR0_9FUNG|nr:hypothetical protein BCR41DRAFT_389052 [Lobosporangium transversale]KAF9898316.1 hypothetical protein BX616_004210 [Lobosporangium transversale]ORZ07035.1 hypothetical protein BCR41DRAFT_389052 [Lobosporangium transversale]|eukprot:XP_021877831.1 hypothetical protein BCR41DRAFT_389052 [Lobosporangium transversale]